MACDGLDRLTSATVGIHGTLPTTRSHDVLDNLTLASQGVRLQTYQRKFTGHFTAFADAAKVGRW